MQKKEALKPSMTYRGVFEFVMNSVYSAIRSMVPVGVVVVFRRPDGSYRSVVRDEEKNKTFWLEGRIEVFEQDRRDALQCVSTSPTTSSGTRVKKKRGAL